MSGPVGFPRCRPPSTTKWVPVQAEDTFEQENRIEFAMSSGSIHGKTYWMGRALVDDESYDMQPILAK